MPLRALALTLLPLLALAAPALAGGSGAAGPSIGPVPLEFVFFAVTLAGVALFHHHTLYVALGGLAVISVFKLAYGFDLVGHIIGRPGHPGEWHILLNLLGLLLGFALLAKHFEESHIPEKLPAILPDDWKGGLALLAIVWVLSSFLDNIAAAMIGGTMAKVVFKGKVHIGYLAAIVAASNAGGAGSVVGDTTTTMMWIAKVHPLQVAEAALGAAVALAVFGAFAARQQHAHQPIAKDAPTDVKVDWMRVLIVFLILVGAISTNILLDFPAAGVWIALLLGAALRHTHWGELPGALKGSVFLLSLVLCASMMPVEKLPAPSWQTALGLGFVSAVFDNIPLTKLAIDQNGYDWGFLAYAVGFGGSMLWFGSSAGVALSNMYPEAKSVGQWLRHGWHIAVAYVLGFFAMLLVVGWQPHMIERGPAQGIAHPTSGTAPVSTAAPAGH
jgi:Na+/H+ antiporter NhaD/arsenite permease-like protein